MHGYTCVIVRYQTKLRRYCCIHSLLHTLTPSPLTAVNDRQYIKEKVSSIKVEPFKPKSNIVIHTTDSEARAAEQSSASEFTGFY